MRARYLEWTPIKDITKGLLETIESVHTLRRILTWCQENVIRSRRGGTELEQTEWTESLREFVKEKVNEKRSLEEIVVLLKTKTGHHHPINTIRNHLNGRIPAKPQKRYSEQEKTFSRVEWALGSTADMIAASIQVCALRNGLTMAQECRVSQSSECHGHDCRRCAWLV